MANSVRKSFLSLHMKYFPILIFSLFCSLAICGAGSPQSNGGWWTGSCRGICGEGTKSNFEGWVLYSQILSFSITNLLTSSINYTLFYVGMHLKINQTFQCVLQVHCLNYIISVVCDINWLLLTGFNFVCASCLSDVQIVQSHDTLASIFFCFS